MAELAELENEALEESISDLPSAPAMKLPSTRPSHRTSKSEEFL